jgi:signal transduction histidine kinase
MSEPVWYRSLYWRIGFGFIALLAVLLAAQIIVFLWLTDRIVGPSSRSPEALATTIATQVGKDLQANSSLRLTSYLPSEFGHIFQAFVVVLNDGQVGSNRPKSLPPGLLRSFAGRGRRGFGEPGRREGAFGRGGLPPEAGTPTPRGETEPAPPAVDRGGERPSTAAGVRAGEERSAGGRGEPEGRGGRRRFETAPIVVDGVERGTVFVPTESQPVFLAVWEVGPTLAWLALALLGVGASVTALLIFRPAHNRLRALEEAATALGQGRTDVRAVEGGGDEVSSLARTFNRMARDLEARASALAESDRARRQLLADVSHELMTPLTAIRGYTETLSMPDLPIDSEARSRYLEIIAEETSKLEALIGDLLDLARLEGGGGTLAFKQVPVADLFGRVVDRHGVTIRDHGLTVTRHIEPPDLTARGDAQRLEQALQNLAANAIRHSPPGGAVALSARRDADGVHLLVHDSGPGIPAEHLSRLFDRFYKVDAARSAAVPETGSGLGLSIVRAIVQRHGGTVTAANAPEGGAVFEIVLPEAAESGPA